MVSSALLSLPTFIDADVAAQEKPVYGGTLVIGTTNPPTPINPILTQHSVSTGVISLIYDPLIRINGEGKVVPGLAKSWEISPDGLEYTFYLREGVKFHDGKELTAADVVYSYQQYSNLQNNSIFHTHFSLVKDFKAIDKYIFKIVLSKPFPSFIGKLNLEIIPENMMEGENAHFISDPIGSGPFKFKNWDKVSNQITLEANHAYFDGRPYLDKIIFKVYPNNEQLWAGLMRQEIDLVKYIKWEDFNILKKDPSFITYKIPWDAYYAVAYNLNDPILSEPDIRRAIAYAINRDQIIKEIFGEGMVSNGPFHPRSIGFNPDSKPLDYDPQKARKILHDRKWTDSNNDGVLDRQNKAFEITMLVDQRKESDKKIAMMIRQQLSEVGIKLIVKLYNDEEELIQRADELNKIQAWLRLYLGGGANADTYDAALNWYSGSAEPFKFWKYQNKKVDKLFELVRSTSSEEKRSMLYKDIYEQIYLDQPICFLFYPMSFHAISSRIRNTQDYFTSYMPDYAIKSWYILN